MPISLAECLRHVKHTLGSSKIGDLDVVRIVNEAGEKLVAAHEWRWLERPGVSVATVLDQTWAALPADLQTILELGYTNGLTHHMVESTIQEIAQYRRQDVSVPAGTTYYSVVDIVTGTPPMSTPRLELYPKSDATAANTFTLYYRAGWAYLTGTDAAYTTTPPWIDDLFIQYLRATARGYQAEDVASMHERIAQIEAGPLFLRKVERDGSIQPCLGPLRGGALGHHPDYSDWNLSTQVAAPS